MNSTNSKQKRMMANFRKAEKLRNDRERCEVAAAQEATKKLETRNAQLEDSNRNLRSRAVAASRLPDDFMKLLLSQCAEMAARKMHEPIAEMMGNPIWTPIIGRVSHGIYEGLYPFARFQQDYVPSMKIMEHLLMAAISFHYTSPQSM